MLSNILTHWKTTTIGVLTLAGVVLSVFTAQGVTLGNIGGGTVVQLLLSLVAAVTLALSKDPGATSVASTPPAAGNLKSLAVLALILPALIVPQGCSATSVAQDIVNWTPTIVSTANTLSSVVQTLAPADAAIVAAATVGFDAAANLLSQQAQTYLKNPTATALGQLQAQVTTFQQNVNKALLTALSVSAASQQKVLTAIQALAVGVNAVFALIASIVPKAAKAGMVASATVKVSQIEPLLLRDPNSVRLVAAHYRISTGDATAMMVDQERQLAAQGF